MFTSFVDAFDLGRLPQDSASKQKYAGWTAAFTSEGENCSQPESNWQPSGYENDALPAKF